ncbi:MAG: AAA family ATPase [Chloroflexi bacterium]|nr:AAA family ATPase [Chloroflexota bacterium]
MRIQRFHIEGFGHFADCSFGPIESPVTILYGLNEAGKSTLLAFVRCVLFGFPKRNRAQHYPALAGGRHGGSIDIEDCNGQYYTVHRIEEPGGVPMTITNDSGVIQDEATLARLVGHQTGDVFKSIFAFALDELYSDDLLKDENVNSQIYSAGMGVTKLPAALKAVNERQNKLFLKGGSKQECARVAAELKEIEIKLRRIAGNAAEFSELSARLERLEEEGKLIRIEHKQISLRLAWQGQLAVSWDDWNDLVGIEAALADAKSIITFPEDGLIRLEALVERFRSARREFHGALSQAKAAESAASVDIDRESILEHSTAIDKLSQGRERIISALRDLPKRETETGERQEELSKVLSDLGVDWDEARLEQFDFSIAVRDEIAAFGDGLREATKAVDERNAQVAQSREVLQEATEAEKAIDEELAQATKPSFDQEQLSRRRASVREAQLLLSKVNEVRNRINGLQDQINALGSPASRSAFGFKQIGIVLFVAAVILGLLLASALLGESSFTWNGLVALAIVCVVAYVLVSNTRIKTVAESPLADQIRKSLKRSETELEEHQSALAQSGATLDLAAIDEATLMSYLEDLDRQQEEIRKWESAVEKLRAAREVVKNRKSKLEQSEKGRKTATALLGATKLEWQDWLRARGLHDSWNAQAIEEIRAGVELGRDRLRVVRESQQRALTIRQSICDYRRVTEPLASKCGIAIDESDANSVVVAVDELVALRKEIEKRVGERETAATELVKARRRIEERKSDLEAVEREKSDLLASGGAANVEQFREREAAYRLRHNLEEKRSELSGRLQKVSGPGERLEALKTSLQETNIQAINDETSRLEEELAEKQSRLTELASERGSINNALQALTGEEESSALRAERGVLRAQLGEYAREWIKHRLAEGLLEEARSTFERERQPGVVRNARAFFGEITGGCYDQVTAPLGEKTIRVSGKDEVKREPLQLSRGTREQLFLALRFGLVQELSQRTEPLPVIVDEVLVNFDPERALRAAMAFVQLSRTNQVLVFTCHPIVVKHFQTAAKEMNSPDPTLIPIERAVS